MRGGVRSELGVVMAVDAWTALDGMRSSWLTSLGDATMSLRPRGGWGVARRCRTGEWCSGGRSSSWMTSLGHCARHARARPKAHVWELLRRSNRVLLEHKSKEREGTRRWATTASTVVSTTVAPRAAWEQAPAHGSDRIGQSPRFFRVPVRERSEWEQVE